MDVFKVIFFLFKFAIAAHSAYDMFSKYKYQMVKLSFYYLGFWSENFFLIAPFPDHCLLVPLYILSMTM